jgi:hypothetical protein
MPADNSFELAVEVDAHKANASIKSVGTGLASMEQAAVHATKGASAGIDGRTAGIVKGAIAGDLFAEGIKSIEIRGRGDPLHKLWLVTNKWPAHCQCE